MTKKSNIVEYNNKYDDDIKELLFELQSYIMSLDKEGYNIIFEENKDEFFHKIMNEIKEYNGKMLLYKEKNKIIGLTVGCINNEETNNIDFKAPKRGRITELIVKKEYRGKKIGQSLFDAMEKHLIDNGCKAILIGVFGYNELAQNFYKKNGYHLRMIDMIKDVSNG